MKCVSDFYVFTFCCYLFCICNYKMVHSKRAAPETSANYCYHGSDVNTLAALQNQTCRTGDLHLTNILKVTDYDINNLKNSTSSALQPSTTVAPDDDIIYQCYVFRHISKQKLSSGLEKESVKIEYGCDYSDACTGMVQDKVLHNVTVKGRTGKLFCCTKDNCNTNEKIPHPPSENRVCYTGPYEEATHMFAKLTSCSHPDTVCAKRTTFKDEKTVLSDEYFCDNSKLCEMSLSTGAYKACTNSTGKNNLTEQLCCCAMAACLKPQWPIISGSGSNSSWGGAGMFDSPMSNPAEDEDDGLVIAGLIGALLLIVSFGVGVLVMVTCKRREQNRDPNVIMQYERLTNSEMDEAVVL